MRHDTGEGWVARTQGDYADALSKGTKVCLVLVETLGLLRESTMQPNANSIPCHSVPLELQLWTAHDTAAHYQAHDRICNIIVNAFLVRR
jgi:hypothetical protein